MMPFGTWKIREHAAGAWLQGRCSGASPHAQDHSYCSGRLCRLHFLVRIRHGCLYSSFAPEQGQCEATLLIYDS